MKFIIGREYKLRPWKNFSKKERNFLDDYCLPNGDADRYNNYGKTLSLKKIEPGPCVNYTMSDGFIYPDWAFENDFQKKLDVLINDK